MEQVNSKTYFEPLTGVRAIAAYMVFLTHKGPFSKELFGGVLHEMTGKLYVGVNFFFVLSGFLIAYNYYHIADLKLGQYLYKRFIRIYPLFFAITTLTFLIKFVIRDYQSTIQPIVLYGLNITFLKGFFSDFFFTGLLQGWSLTVEETFYILAPAIFFMVRKSKFWLFMLPVVFISGGMGLVSLFSQVDFYGFFGSYRLLFSGIFFGRCIEFFLGIYLAILIRDKKLISVRIPVTYVGILCILVCIYFIPVGYNIDKIGIYYYGLLLRNLLLPLFIVLFYYGLIVERTKVSQVLGSKFFVLLGKSSYAFYLIHIGYFDSFLKMLTSSVLLSFLFTNVAAIVIYYYFEEPVRKLFMKKSIRRTDVEGLKQVTQ